MNVSMHDHASASMMSSTQSGQTFMKPSMLHGQIPDNQAGFGPGPLHVRMSIPMHQTVAPYMIPSGHQNYVMEKRTKLGADKQVCKFISKVYCQYTSLIAKDTVDQLFCYDSSILIETA